MAEETGEGADRADGVPEAGPAPASGTHKRRVGVGIFLVVLVLLVLVNLVGGLLVPFLLGLLGALALRPAVDRLASVGVPLWVSSLILTIVAFLLTVGAVAALGYVFSDDLANLFDRIPSLLAQHLERGFSALKDWGFKVEPDVTAREVEELLRRLAPWGSSEGSFYLTVAGGAVKTLLLVFVTPFATFYLLADRVPVDELIRRRLSPADYDALVSYWREARMRFVSYVKGQGLLCLSQAILHTVGLSLIGLDFAVVIGLLTGLLAIVPTVGNLLMFSIALAVAGMQFTTVLPILGVIAVYGVSQTLESTVLAPKLIGGQIRMHPLLVLFLVLAAGVQLGILGAFLVLPLAAFATVAFGYLRYEQSG
ncbi:MAG: AI-2E family transporter [Alphaproteobacteria bacterium]|nr:AI-2E family transporter [Alphaproteobacteria bacterium]